MNHVSIQKIINNVNIKATASAYSDPILCENGQDFGIIVTAIAGSAPEVNITYQVIASYQGDGTKVGDVSSGEGNLDWITPNTGATIASAVAADMADGFAPMVSKWIRIAVTGTASNHATDTYITVHLTQNDRI